MNGLQLLGKKVIFASSTGAMLDSDVYRGGGTDDTAILQEILDQAPALGGLHLVMDGAALVKGLRVHSNTTIQCLNQDCGFYLADHTNDSIIKNANGDLETIHDRNITLIGGTYNQNCAHQEHHVDVDEEGPLYNYTGLPHATKIVYLMEFYGVENLTVRDVVLRDQRTHAFVAANWKHLVMENIHIDLPGRMQAQNQDGLHFYGPGQFLVLRNIRGCSGDDFIALTPDEIDRKSDITDVLIDGVFLDDADQGIRMLSRNTGRLDRVTIRNVMGTYRSFGFYINPWYRGQILGNYGSIVLENIDLRQTAPNYDYTTPFLFRVGGNIESLVLRNITHHLPYDGRPLLEVGWPCDNAESYASDYRIGAILVDGLRVIGNEKSAVIPELIRLRCKVDHVTVRNAEIYQDEQRPGGCLVHAETGADIKTMLLSGVDAEGLHTILKTEGMIRHFSAVNVRYDSLKGGIMEKSDEAVVNVNVDHCVKQK